MTPNVVAQLKTYNRDRCLQRKVISEMNSGIALLVSLLIQNRHAWDASLRIQLVMPAQPADHLLQR